AEVDEGCLDAWFQVDDSALVNVSDVVVLAMAFNVELFEPSIFHDSDAAFFGLCHIDQHFLLHGVFQNMSVVEGCAAAPRPSRSILHRGVAKGIALLKQDRGYKQNAGPAN